MPSTPYTITMSETGPSPDPLSNVAPGSKIVWTNAMSVATNLTYPTCVSPGGSATIDAGASSPQQTVNSGANGSYSYSYAYSTGATSDGTIDVS